ncbi:MAG: type II secretion system F family protein [Candidatus Binatia bacterium]
MQPVLISLFISLAVATVSFGLLVKLRGNQTRETVLSRLRDDPVLGSDEEAERSILRDVRLSKVSFINELLERVSVVRVLEKLLVQSRSGLRPDDVIIRCMLMGLGGVVAVQYAYGSTIFGLLAGSLLAALPVASLMRKRSKRFDAFDKQLPDALTMMKNSLQAGYTLNRAMQVVAEEMPEPISEEFRDTVEELRLGLPVAQAMNNLNNRVVNDNLEIFIAAVLIQFEIGGNLTELLDNISSTIRERFKVEGEVKSLTAEGRISGVVIGLLPIALALIISVMQPSYLKPLFATEQGHTLLGFAAVFEVIGFICIRKVSRISF